MGIGPSKLEIASELLIASLLAEHVADLASQQCGKKHVALARNRTTRLCQECGWKTVGDIRPEGFIRWRTEKGDTLGPKTTNDYLSLVSVFLDWLVKTNRLPANPLKHVDRAVTAGRERRVRRALSDAEIELLVKTSGKRSIAWFVAAYTGIRRGELQALHWADLRLDDSPPRIALRASTTKNSRADFHVLHADVAAELRLLREANGNPTGKVFPRGVPTAKMLRKDLVACGIQPTDELGRRVDFHALRHTRCTTMQRYGVSQRAAQHQMRHSDPRLTAESLR